MAIQILKKKKIKESDYVNINFRKKIIKGEKD